MFIKVHFALAGRCVCLGVDGSSYGRFCSRSHTATATNHGMSPPRLNLDEKDDHLPFTADLCHNRYDIAWLRTLI